jgi:hypothetical protein
VRAVVEHPAGYDPLLAHRDGEVAVAFRQSSTLGIRDGMVFEADDERSFMESSHPPFPFDQQGLVALEFLSASRTEVEELSEVGAGPR